MPPTLVDNIANKYGSVKYRAFFYGLIYPIELLKKINGLVVRPMQKNRYKERERLYNLGLVGCLTWDIVIRLGQTLV